MNEYDIEQRNYIDKSNDFDKTLIANGIIYNYKLSVQTICYEKSELWFRYLDIIRR